MGVVAGTVPIKTAAGQDELVTRQRRLSQRHRTVLFLVDGRRHAADVRRMALQAGVPETCFDELLTMGLITLPEVVVPSGDGASGPASVLHVDLPLGAVPGADSLLPPSRTLYPSLSTDSTLGDSRGPVSWLPSGGSEPGAIDPVVAEVRLILARAVRAEAPLAGSLTLLKLRRARTRGELALLLDEVEARITKPHRSLAASQTMQRVRQLLASRVDSSLVPA
ncbi:hypothetical protein ASC76_11895 [Rhizobacter sp. Root404]|nr:hypothetical protein ASC76_11895 [Rhizobacter sp. Root404]